MKILLNDDRLPVLKLLDEAQKEKNVGEQSRMYEHLGREYVKDLILTCTAIEQLCVDAQAVLVAAVLQAGGELTIEQKHVAAGVIARLDRDLIIQHGRDLYLSVSDSQI